MENDPIMLKFSQVVGYIKIFNMTKSNIILVTSIDVKWRQMASERVKLLSNRENHPIMLKFSQEVGNIKICKMTKSNII